MSLSTDDTLLQPHGPVVVNVNVREFGAKGDGATDDTLAIQGAINYVAGNGGQVFIPSGTYMISTPLQINTNGVALVGAARGSSDSNLGTIIRAFPGYTGSALIHVSQGGTPSQPLNGITISHMLIHGGGKTNGTAVDGIYFQAYNSLIFDVETALCSGHGVHVKGLSGWHTYNTKATHCISHDNAGDGFHWSATGSTDSTEAFCHAFANGGHGSYVGQSGHVIDACHHYGNTGHGVMLDGVANGAQLVGSEFEYNKMAGVYLNDNGTNAPWGVMITGCNFYGNSAGAANTYDNLTMGEGATANAVQATIVGCQFLSTPNTPRYGVNLASTHAHNVILANNFFDGTYGTGFINAAGSATPGHQCSIRGNMPINPVGPLGPPTVPTSGTALNNPYNYDCMVYVSGGTVTGIAVGSTTTGLTSGGVLVQVGQSIKLTYSVAPTWVWMGQ